MKKAFVVTAALALLSMGGIAQANITIDTVAVGNAGNAADTTGYGAVAYNYNIGKNDVTTGQYTAFLNAVAATDTYGLYNTGMAGTNAAPTYGCGITQSGVSGSYTYSAADPNLPVINVSYWSACAFANWINNGQLGAGTTQTGAYTLTASGEANNTITRNVGATWAVANENEWYKAAYYDPTLNGGVGGYWTYATQSNTDPTASLPTSAPNSSNSADSNSIPAVGTTTDVGVYTGSASYYGTFDQNGNVFNWNESISGTNHAIRGGNFACPAVLEASSFGDIYIPASGGYGTGFRLVQAVPEPSSIVALLGGLVSLLGIRRRKA